MKLKHHCLSLFIMLLSLPALAQNVSVEGYTPYYISSCIDNINSNKYSDEDAIQWSTVLLEGKYKVNGEGDKVNPLYFIPKADMSKVRSDIFSDLIRACVNAGIVDWEFFERNISCLNYRDAMKTASFFVDVNAPEQAVKYVEQADKYRTQNNVSADDRIKYSPYAAKAYLAAENVAKGNEIIEQALKQQPNPGKYDGPAIAVIAKYLKTQPNADKKLREKFLGKLNNKQRELYVTDQIWLIDELRSMGKAKDAAKVIDNMKYLQYSLPEKLILAKYFIDNGDKPNAEKFIADAYNKWGNYNVQGLANYIPLSVDINGKKLTVGQMKDVYAALNANDTSWPGMLQSVRTFLEENGQGDFIAEQDNLSVERLAPEIDKASKSGEWSLSGVFNCYQQLKNYQGTKIDKEKYLADLRNLLSAAYNANFEVQLLTALYNNRELFGDYTDTIMETSIANYSKDSHTPIEVIEILMGDDSQKEVLAWIYPEISGKVENPSEKDQNLLNKAAESIGVATSFEQNGFRYTVKGKTLVAEYIGNAADVTFPTTVTHDGTTYKVTTIVGAAENNSIRTVTIPDGIEKILAYAFKGCKNLTTIKISKDLKTIYGTAFGFCPNLTNVVGLNFTDVEGSNAAVKNFLFYCYDSPKMLDVLYKQLTAKYNDENLEFLANDYLLSGRYNSDFEINGKLATVLLAKRILTTLAAKGDAVAMIDICNYYINEPNSKVISAADYLKYAKMLLSTKKKAFGYFFMGGAYEYGRGVTPSRTQAHSYYAKGRELNDADCERGWWRTL